MKKYVTVKISYDHENDREAEKAAKRLVQADRAFFALTEVRDEIFRPSRKHGYADTAITEMIEKINGHLEKAGVAAEFSCEELIGELEKEFIDILQNHGLDLDDL